MTIQRFESWLAGLDRLSDAQWSQLHTAVQERSEAGAALAAIELQVDSERRCRHCHGGGAVRLGLSRGLWRYCCKRCGKTFNALTGTALSGSHNKQRWLTLVHLLVTRESVRQSAQRCGVAVTTAFRYRHRFPEQTGQLAGRLDGLVEAEETYLLHSCKGHGQPARKARRRGRRASKRGLSKQQVPVLLTTTRGGATAGQVLQTVSQASLPAALEPLLARDAVLLSDGGRAYPGSARRLGVQHDAVNASAGRRVRGSHHIQTINNRHQQWKQFLRPFRGVATKYLDSYLRWFQQVGLVREASLRRCLGPQWYRSACVSLIQPCGIRTHWNVKLGLGHSERMCDTSSAQTSPHLLPLQQQWPMRRLVWTLDLHLMRIG